MISVAIVTDRIFLNRKVRFWFFEISLFTVYCTCTNKTIFTRFRNNPVPKKKRLRFKNLKINNLYAIMIKSGPNQHTIIVIK